MLSFESVLAKALVLNPRLDENRVTEAFRYAEKLHAGEYRLSGDPYTDHVLAVADILLSLTSDEDTLIAAFLHSITDCPNFDDRDFKERFGEVVHFLVHAYDSLGKVRSRDETTEAEVIRRMFFTIAKDLRVILMKMADRLHNMETLSYREVAKQKQIAKETLDIYVPISARLGIYTLKSRLEDRAFKYLHPHQYKHLKQELDEYILKRSETIDDIKVRLQQFLASHGIEAQVEGRIKNLYSIYRKLKDKSHSILQDIYDIYAFRVTLPTRYDDEGRELNDHLYTVLGLIQSNPDWKPVPHRFKDYVVVPKSNGYKSLHTAVLGLSANFSQPTEVQIRSKRMDDEAEYGVASHWLYDDLKSSKGTLPRNRFSVEYMSSQYSSLNHYVEWIASLAKVQDELMLGNDSLDGLKTDFFRDRIFVMTPDGDVRDLPKGATPIDFAYSIHTDIGHCTQLAKVNGKVVPLHYKLKNGEKIEIITGPVPHPKSAWLSFVKTSGAKMKIRSFFRTEDRGKLFQKGKDLLNSHLERMGQPVLDDDLSLLRYLGKRRLAVNERIELVEDVGMGSVVAASLLKKLLGGGRSHKRGVGLEGGAHGEAGTLISAPRAKRSSLAKKGQLKPAKADQIFIDGMDGLPHRLANCCKPHKGVAICAYVSRDHVLTVHVQSCKLLRAARQDRIIAASWAGQELENRYPVKLELEVKERLGLIRDIADVMTGMHVNILSFQHKSEKDSKVFREAVVEVVTEDQLKDLIHQLQRVRDVLGVKRLNGRRH